MIHPLHKEPPEAAGSTRSRLLVASLLIAWLGTWPLSAASNDADWHFGEVERIVAISDVHGDFDAMLATLSAAGIIDGAQAWSGGTAHLVISGDLLDRGPDSRKAMDVVIRLEAEAEAAGGAVHQLLGNHEIMNLVGDLRYVAAEEFAAFAGEEDPASREIAYAAFLERRGSEDDEAARAAFAENYPPGFFAHRRAFRSDGEYGAWLLDKPIVVVVNDTAFTHGGLSPMVIEFGLDGINNGLVGDVREYVRNLDTVIDAGLLDPAENFYRHPSALENVSRAALSEDVANAVDNVIRLNGSPVHDPSSPLWYRGNVGCGPLIETDRLDSVLDAIDAKRVVIGHTPTLTREVLSRLDGRVVEIDTGMLSAYYEGSGHALIIEGDELSVLAEGATAPVAVREHPRRVGIRPDDVGAVELELMLAEGDIAASGEADDGQVPVTVTEDGVQIAAVFIPNPRGDDFVPDLAAYRLDRFLHLDMVPVTVAREFEGVEGVVQFVPQATMDEQQRRETSRGGSAWCPLPEQWEAMYVFDTLIHNPGRAQDRMLYSQDNWQLILTGHDVSFETSRSRPGYLRDVPLDIGSYWQSRLTALSGDVVEEMFADTLDRRRRRALSIRRDRLLEDAARAD